MDEKKLLSFLKTFLIEKAFTVSVAETSTAGLLSNHLTRLPGASVYYKGGIIAYSNDIKRNVLLIKPVMLRLYGAVSSEVTLAMAQEAKRMFGTDIGLSVSGITGPSGGTEEKPVGLTFISIAAPGFERTEQFILEGGREEIRHKSVQKALLLLHTFFTHE